MARFAIWLVWSLALLACSVTSATIVEHSFNVEDVTVRKMCRDQVITAVNESLPGPTIKVREGDTLVVHVFNKSPYDITIHWHGILQLLSAWADGPAYATQCPIRPGQSYTYRFNITGQEGTLWWHAHVGWLRATVYGALILHPKSGRSYPFSKPYKEVPILLGEWWNANVVDVENEGLALGIPPNASDAYTINGKLGDRYNCSQNDTYKLTIKRGKTYMLRIINAALNNQFFFKIANHSMTVVAIDAAYTDPYDTDFVVVAPGQTTDVLFKADQPVGSYYMAAHPYITVSALVPLARTPTRGIIKYEESTSASAPVMPTLPDFNDTARAHQFFTNITGLAGGPQWVPVPLDVDEHMFITFGLNKERCPENATCRFAEGQRFSASMNNESFVLPNRTSMLEAFYKNERENVYTTDFPDAPPVPFDYTNESLSNEDSLIFAPKSTKVKKLKFNSTVEVVWQNTAFLGLENHPIHIHGFNFHVLAQGFGNYDAVNDRQKFNLVNPQIRNTVAVPVGGWAVTRFQANNPGVWLVHCHLDVHFPFGMAMAFEVENGNTPSSTLPPPPSDLPKC